MRCFGSGESEIEGRLPDLVRRGQDPLVGITASQATITLRVTAEGATAAECEAKIEPTVATIYRCLGPLIYAEGGAELQDAVLTLLADRPRTLSTMEWGTAGLVADWLGGVAESEALYRGGIVVRDEGVLVDVLGVDAVRRNGPRGGTCRTRDAHGSSRANAVCHRLWTGGRTVSSPGRGDHVSARVCRGGGARPGGVRAIRLRGAPGHPEAAFGQTGIEPGATVLVGARVCNRGIEIRDAALPRRTREGEA